MKNPFKRPFPSDEFGGYGSFNVWRELPARADPDWYSLVIETAGAKVRCAVPSVASVTVGGSEYLRPATDEDKQRHCDVCRGCAVWWRRASENPKWKPARLKGGAA